MDRGPRLVLCQDLTTPPAESDCTVLMPVQYPELRGKTGELLGREAWLEEALAQYPDLLLVDRIDPHADKLVLVGKQLEVPNRGILDLLFLELGGVLTIVETKLADNFEGRREVFAQIMDYATYPADIPYEQFEHWICKRDQPLENASKLTAELWRRVGALGEPTGVHYEKWSKEFREKLEDNLRRRRLRLVIVAERIDPRLRDMLEFNLGSARPDFQVALVEITPYKLPGHEDRLLIVPSLYWSRTPTIPHAEMPSKKIRWTQKAFLEQTRQNNPNDEAAAKMVEEIYSWMVQRKNALGQNARLEWPATTAKWPTVNLRIQGARQAIPALGGEAGGGGWISCRNLMRQHPKAVRAFLERVKKLDPYKQLAGQLLNGEKNELKMTWVYLGKKEDMRKEVLAAMEELQDAIISGSR